ncbi:MAG: PD-(D/E)XK nuclease family protein, partial [Actinomycetota bacterium]|nr:PD-(D/E)XK nuclease family protein [Actinomycetota bacterium]
RLALAGHGSAELALWALWEHSGWPSRLAAAARAGGQQGRAADRDLDAVVALFDLLLRFDQSRPGAGVGLLLAELEAQEIPPASRVEGALAGTGVRLLTAHRAKGLEWDLVVVAGVQDGSWPDVRRRGSLLESDRLGRDGVRPPAPPSTLLVEERRLFYVAITRARRRLVVTAVQSADDAGARPSRFLDELGVEVLEPAPPSGHALSIPALTGRLRRAAADLSTSEAVRSAAAAVLARLAAPGPDGRPLVPAAVPAGWWGMLEPSPGAVPVRPADQPVTLSASAVAAFDRCPLRWFLEREARAGAASTAAQGFGTVLHALARLVSTGALPEDPDVLVARLDTVWDALGFEAPWLAARERDKARAALERLVRWLHSSDRTHLGSEVPFGPVEVAGAVLAGTIDRLDVDSDGRLHVVDYKTSRTKPTAAEVAADLQLGVYQLAVQHGAMAEQAAGHTALGGAELVQLVDGRAGGSVSVQRQDPLPADGGRPMAATNEMVTAVLHESFPARPNNRCHTCPFQRACPAVPAGRQVVS